MSKSIEDYREIVKVLKLQLLKIRQQNNSLSKQLGVAPQTESSSFTPRVQKFKNSNTSIGKYLYLYNLFAHKCQLIGVSPEMVFRIADKKRDKEVYTNNMRQIMRRLKLKLNDDQISRLLDSITKSDKIFYEQYLQYLSAFQINSQIYPYKGQRTYPQKCLLKFGDEVKAKDSTATELCRNIIEKEGTPYISYQSFVKYCRSNKLKLKDVQIICAFVALDTQSQCQLSKDQFIRQMNKIYNLLEKGISYEDDVINQKPKKTQKNEQAQFELTQQTGTQAGAKTKKKQTGKQVKANKNDLVQILEKQGISTNTLILKLLQKEEKRNLLRPFGLNDFCKVVQSLKSSITKKKVLQFFKNLDSSNNGSVSTDQLIKIWLEGKKVTDNPNTLLQLLARHFKQIQSKQYITRFNTLGYKNDDKINTQMLKNVLSGLDLEQNYIKLIQSNLSQNITVDQFVKTLQKGGVDNQQKEFKPLSKSEFQKMKGIVYKFINEKQKTNYQFKKLCRLQNQEDPQKQNNYWQTIFTDEWACWNYCLETAYKLDSFWRDHEFGPSKGDPHGYRSIVGNSSKIPSGLPDQQEITWLTFEKLLELQNNKKEEVKLFSDNLVANDILQGKIGNCWFVSALSIITSNDELIYGKPLQYCKRNPEGLTFGIHPVLFHYFRRFGIYVFKFFKNFKPVYVVVDNLFPVEVSNNQLAFAKSPNAGLQWVAFLQKAFAKLHHSYTNLISGQISQGLSDLTSCLPIKQSLVNNRSDELLQKMKTLSKQKQLMGCSINLPPNSKSQSPVLLDDEKTGLFYGHAYSLMDLIDLNQVSNKDFKLVRVRNPWGHGQWCLDWSDKPLNDEPEYEKLKQNLPIINKYYDEKIAKGKKMKQNVKDIQKYETGQDGQFLMNFYDFAKIFTNLFTGYNIKDKQYKCYQFKGKWNKATPSGICKAKGASEAEKVQFVKNNYQFILEVKEETDIIIFLMQEDGRLYRGQQFPYKEICNGINILVFTLKNDQMLDKFETEKMTLPNLKFELKRQVSFWHKFKQGRYAIVPCKIANKIPQTQIQIRLYADKPVQSLKKIKGAEGTNFTDLPESSKIYKQSVISQMIDLVGKLQSTK